MSLLRIWNPAVFEQEEVCVEVEESTRMGDNDGIDLDDTSERIFAVPRKDCLKHWSFHYLLFLISPIRKRPDWDGKLNLSGRDCQRLGVSGASVVCVDLFGGCTLVQANRSVEEVIAGCVIVVAACVVREVVFERRARQFFGKEKEQNLIEFVK